jgi:predicted ATPase
MSTGDSARVALQNLDMARDRLLRHVDPIAGNDAISERAVKRIEAQARDDARQLRN